ncbi:MAG TPA: hypothetical protein VKS25_05210 [Solirubrobacteraceae bacterium]|nr:hypothetical protein [Solirubrobacteraceae bacterium]
MAAARFKFAGAAFVALLAALVLSTTASAVPTTTEIVIPAGDIATISNAAFGDDTINPGNCPADRLAYGYELNSGPNVQVATGVGCDPVSGATIGPFAAPTQLRIYLGDVGCGDTFYSDGLHALTTASNPFSWNVSIMDSDLCTSGPSDPRAPIAQGTGNFNATVTLTPATPAWICATTWSLVTGSARFASGSPWSRELADMMVTVGCIAIQQVSMSPSPRNALFIGEYERNVTTLVQGGWLSATQGGYLSAAASAL